MLTVLFATYNGSLTLERSLHSLTKLNPPEGGYKLVIVDNASVDDTREIIASFKNKLPLTYLRTERQGKNIALNEGLKHVEGDLVVLTDDDTTPNKDWLTQHRKMANAHPDISMWGGTIEPIWPQPPPRWILEQVPLGAVYALTDRDQTTGPIAPDMIWGPNMAVRTAVFEEGHLFNEDIGPAAGQYTMGSEVEFTCRIAEAGHKSWFLSEAVVGHMIRPSQVQRQWVVNRAFRFGKLKHLQSRQNNNDRVSLILGVPRWMYGAVFYNTLKSTFHLFSGNQEARFKADWDRQYHMGYISAAWKAMLGV